MWWIATEHYWKRLCGDSFATLQAVSLFPQRPETAIPGAAGNRCFCLLGQRPKPSEQTAPLVWLRGILPLSGYRPLLIFRSLFRSGDCGFPEGTGAAPAKFSPSALPACFRNS